MSLEDTRGAGSTRGVGTSHCNGTLHPSATGVHGGARASRQRIRSRAIAAYESLAQCHLSDWEGSDA